MLSDHIARLFALRYLGNLAKDAIVDWALAELEVGRDSESLRILAGMRDHPYPTEVELYFFRALKELEIETPDKAQALNSYCRFIAEQIVNSSITPRNGCKELYWVYRSLDYPSELLDWLLLAEGLDPQTNVPLNSQQCDAAVTRQANELLKQNPLFSRSRFLESNS